MRETYNFTDSSYDGLVKDNSLFGGLGMLTDGHLAPADYANTRGVGWIGWNAEDTPDPYIRFQFLNTRIFHSVTIHCNVRDEADVQLFSNVTIRFGEDVATFDKSLSFKPKQISSGLGWKNYNVTIDLCKHVGKFMELKFTHVGNWILISEISFNSGKFLCFFFERHIWTVSFHCCEHNASSRERFYFCPFWVWWCSTAWYFS